MSTEKELSKAERVKKDAVLTMQYSCPKLAYMPGFGPQNSNSAWAMCFMGDDGDGWVCNDGSGETIGACIFGSTAVVKKSLFIYESI
jgi:hypothetical protein